MIGLNRRKRLGAISGLIMFALGDETISYRAVSFFSVKFLTRFCKAARLPLPFFLTAPPVQD